MILAVALTALFSVVGIPPLSGPVVDQAKVLSAQEVQDLGALARSAHETGGPQIAFLLLPSLEGEPIEGASIRAAEAWRLGTKEDDDGLLFVVSVGDRQVRIEVGGGLEGEITDAQASRIIRETVVPAFRREAYGDGLYAAAVRTLDLAGWEGAAEARRGEPEEAPGWARLVFLLIFVVMAFFMSRFGSFGGGGGFPGGGGGFPRGGGGFPRGGGGGYRGGGGGFSGGGASGRW